MLSGTPGVAGPLKLRVGLVSDVTVAQRPARAALTVVGAVSVGKLNTPVASV